MNTPNPVTREELVARARVTVRLLLLGIALAYLLAIPLGTLAAYGFIEQGAALV